MLGQITEVVTNTVFGPDQMTSTNDHGYEDCASDQPGPEVCGFHPEGVAVGMGA